MNKAINIINPDELEEKIRLVVSELLQSFKTNSPKQDKVLITRKEVAEELQISLVTLHDWVNKGYLPQPSKIGNRSYFHYEEFNEFLNNLKSRGDEKK
jgi:predicted DNA-binding transcriptional regulator AlpA